MKIDAGAAQKGPDYFCPNCHGAVILRKGRIVAHNFSHKPPTSCSWAVGETQEHLAAKLLLRDAYRMMGYQADYEVVVLSSGGDRRADVYVISPDGGLTFAIEVQHTPILYDAIEKRTVAYMAVNVPVMWLGILGGKMRETAERTQSGLIIRQYPIRPWEKWAQALCFGELWYIDPVEESLWKGRFSDHLIDVPSSSWYGEGGEEMSAGGYSRKSKRWRTLHLEGPFRVHEVNEVTKWRRPWTSSAFNLPGGHFASFEKR
ncbi:hypothetical protein G4G27_10970 [Sphingomonas sp. So64.6b]|uniref:competence protein CoiA n=1 Tax=Sphingomonas sp. So64.6b TaxID=2997354 RepID=UPI0015FFF4AB|nr:competence protein CoiA family protein [Sphingomonas sp. So64.6b]QNA84453.1 hypothetical protein G4G27_10970 [Sphingomonas sp. So64.6b]